MPSRRILITAVAAFLVGRAAWTAKPQEVSFGLLRASIGDDGAFGLVFGDATIVERDFATRHVEFAPADTEVQVTRDERRAVITVSVKGDLAFLKRTIILRESDCIVTWQLIVRADEPVPDGAIGFFIPRRLLHDVNFYVLDRVGRYLGRDVRPVEQPKLIDVDGPLSFQMEFACSPGPGGAPAGWALQDYRPTEGSWRQAVTFGTNPPGGVLTAVARFDFAPAKENWQALAAWRQEKGNIYIDYLDLVEHPFTFSLERSAKYVTGNAPVTVVCNYLSSDSAPRKLDVTYEVTDYAGREVAAGKLAFSNDGAATLRRSVKVRTSRLGMCRFVLTFRDRDGAFEGTRETVWAVLPPQPDRGPMPSSLFGAHVARSDYYYGLAQAMGVKWVRLQGIGGDDTHWSALEVKSGNWRWPRDFAGQSLAEKHKMSCLGLLTSPPEWTADSFDEDFEQFLTAWSDYVRRAIGYFEGRVEYWEVWNEPYRAFAGRAGDYAELLRRTYQTAKRADPACTIVGTGGPPPQMPSDWYVAAFKPFGLTYQDAVSAHLYPPRTGIRGSELRLREAIREIRQHQTKFGTPKPIWNTQMDVPAPESYFRHPNHRPLHHLASDAQPIPAEEVAGYLVRQYVVSLAEGVRTFCYAVNGGPQYDRQLCEYDGTPMPACAAYAQLASLLQTAEHVRDLSMTEGIQGYLFADGYTPIVVLWATELSPGEHVELRVSLPRGGARVLDLMGNPVEFRGGKHAKLIVTGAPRYVVGDKVTVAEIEEALTGASVREWRRNPP